MNFKSQKSFRKKKKSNAFWSLIFKFYVLTMESDATERASSGLIIKILSYIAVSLIFGYDRYLIYQRNKPVEVKEPPKKIKRTPLPPSKEFRISERDAFNNPPPVDNNEDESNLNKTI